MNVMEKISEDRRRIVNKIIERLENGDLIFSKDWNAEMLRPNNPVSGVQYKGANRIKLMSETIDKEYKDPRWLTYKQAEENGWNIKKGAKGVLCEKWIFTKKVTVEDELGKKITEEIKLSKPIPNFFYVFNAEQIEGIPEFKKEESISKDQTRKIVENFIVSSECPIKEIAIDKAYYNADKDEIHLPIKESFFSEDGRLSTILHEMIHSTGHYTRLNRNLIGSFGSPKYAKEELVAELGAVFLKESLGIKLDGEHINNHSAYIKSWINILKNDPNQLFIAAVEAEKATDRLIEIYNEREKEKLKEIKTKPMDFLKVYFKFSEAGANTFGVEDKMIYHGEKAYKLLENLIEYDNNKDSNGYGKTYINIFIKGYETGEIRLDLGNKEFGNFTKVSEALDYRLKSNYRYVLNNVEEYTSNYNSIHSENKKTIEEMKEIATEKINEIDKIIKYFNRQEEKFINEIESKYSEEKKVELPVNKKIKDKEKSIER